MRKDALIMLAVSAFGFAGGAAAADGKGVYDRYCVACHASGAAGSPKIGDKKAWAPRIAKGVDALYNTALNGKPGTAMLPKGTCSTCSEDEVKKAVDYMVGQSK